MVYHTGAGSYYTCLPTSKGQPPWAVGAASAAERQSARVGMILELTSPKFSGVKP